MKIKNIIPATLKNNLAGTARRQAIGFLQIIVECLRSDFSGGYKLPPYLFPQKNPFSIITKNADLNASECVNHMFGAVRIILPINF